MPSNLPPGANVYRFDPAVPHRCPQCGAKWVVPMFFELGGWFYPPELENVPGGSDCPNGCDPEKAEPIVG
ncbi:hypothetical protein kuro4_00280 [Gelria sp. Kuro-4]|nr:hypothetical protein kuro4_00280 [Gelria sp. Kuro-4]